MFIYGKESCPFIEVRKYLNLGYKPEEIFILALSIKNKKLLVRNLENSIKRYMVNIPIYVSLSDEEKLNSDILKNKLVFSTFHQAK